MEVHIKKDSDRLGLLITPETQFEEDYLTFNFGQGRCVDGYLKRGVTNSQVVGLVVYKGFYDESKDAKE